MVCHMVVQSAMWFFTIGPRIDQKIPKMSDTWQPLVLPCHHDNIIMTHVTLFVCHVPCTDVDFIHTNADVNSTYADSSLLTGLG
jgi:hypothetical protein